MKRFAELFRQLDQTTKINTKIAALHSYFKDAGDRDKLWAIALFSHKRPRRSVNTTLIRQWAAEVSKLPLWLFEESYHIVGDLAETIALVTPTTKGKTEKSLSQYIEEIKALYGKEESIKKEYVLDAWSRLDQDERFLFNKLITGGFRIGVSEKLILKGLSKATEIEEGLLAHRLMGNWDPSEVDFHDLIFGENETENKSRPYPFYLAHALEGEVHELGNIDDWYAERKWDGIRGQIINRENHLFIWSRGEDLLTEKFPEFSNLLDMPIKNYVLDGEIIGFKDRKILSFNALQTRIGRKKVSKKHLSEYPVVMIAYDILEWQGEDLRSLPMYERRTLLESIVNDLSPSGVMHLSALVPFNSWEQLKRERENSRLHSAEGLMLKHKSSSYKVGRKRGDWWKWKVDPMTVDAVMIYAQRGHGRRANLYSDFTFAVWTEEGSLVPFAKAYSGLTDKEFNEISRWVRKNTIERFGPVCSVKPELVFELAFEGIAPSSRHKSGIALRFPRIKRWRHDKTSKEADTLSFLTKLLDQS